MKVGRNDPCPCGSGKKYKRCCLPKESSTAGERSEPIIRDVRGKSYEEKAFWQQALTNMRRIWLDQKPHIKAYYKLRKLHGEIIDAMVQYYQGGHFEQKIDESCLQSQKVSAPENDVIQLLQCEFDFDTREGTQAFYDMMIYKAAPNMNCLTEVFLQKHRYRKEDKIALLHSMLNSTLGLFEISGVDENEGYVFLKEVFTGKQYTVIDVALSGTGNYDEFYIYSRIIEYQGVCFGSGLNIPFFKSDKFIRNHIERHRKDYRQNEEFIRLVQVYNQFSRTRDGVTVVANSLG